MSSFLSYKALANKHLRVRITDLRSTAIVRRFVGPKVLINSIPKVGTNLVEQTLSQFPLLHRSGLRTLRGWSGVSPSTLKKNFQP